MGTISSEHKIPAYLVFFDLDYTLINTISSKALVLTALGKGLLSISTLARAIYISLTYKLKLKDPLKAINEMIKWIQGIPEKSMNDLCSETFNKFLLSSIYPDARSEIKLHKQRNAKTIILSSSILSICREVAVNLDLDDIICSIPEVTDNHYTGYFNGNICFGNEKAVRLKAYCENINTVSGETWYYGDSITDLPVLNLVNHPVCINPDKKLRKRARLNGWEIKDWH